MPILKGAMGYQRFLVGSKDKGLTPQALEEKLNLFRFRLLHVAGIDNESLGFCPYLAEYDHEKDIAISDFLYDKNIILSMRFDTIKLPRELLKAMIKKALTAYEAKNQKAPDRVVRKEIELAEANALRARILPKTKILEAIWLVESGELRIFSRSATLVERFLDLFKQTFLLNPERQDFVQRATSFSNNSGQTNAFEGLVHQTIFAPPVRIDVQ